MAKVHISWYDDPAADGVPNLVGNTNGFITVHDDGSISITVDDDWYNGVIKPEDVIRLRDLLNERSKITVIS